MNHEVLLSRYFYFSLSPIYERESVWSTNATTNNHHYVVCMTITGRPLATSFKTDHIILLILAFIYWKRNKVRRIVCLMSNASL